MFDILIWYLAILAIGIITIPIGIYLFGSLRDFGYPMFRIVGLAIISYSVWILGMSKLIPFGLISISASFGVLIFLSLFCLKKIKGSVDNRFIKTALVYEAIFFVVFGMLIAYKLYRSDISDIEKFMDFAFLNTILKTSYFPPIDPWFSGHTMNYYYFGHLVTAVLTKMTMIKASVAYNLMQVTNYAFFMIGVISLSFNLTKKYLWTAITTIIAAGMSNINYLILSSKKLESYWWEGTRIIPGTINEFPLYSFLLGDLHAHYLDLPFVMTVFLSLYAFFVKEDDRMGLKVFIGFILGLLFLTNSWDYLVYGSLFAVLSIYKNAIKNKDYIKVVKDGLVAGLTSIIVLLPFYLSFHPASGGFNLVTAPKSLLRDFLILFILQVFVIGFYLIYKFIKSKSSFKIISLSVAAIGGLIIFPFSQVTALVFVFLPLWLTIVIYDTQKTGVKKSEQFLNIIVLAAFAIIVFCEYFYLKDIYGIDFQRANTVFKFYYQLWIIFAIATGYIGSYFSDKNPVVRNIFYFVAGSLLVASTMNLPVMVYNSANSFKTSRGLDGAKYLEETHPADYKAIGWLNINIKGLKVIAEAPGDSYTYDSRISVFTGSQTPLGWLGHEWGWRNNPNELNGIKDDIKTLYTTDSIDEAKTLVSKYKINYIYFGEIESQRYSTPNWAIRRYFKNVYDRSGIQIYKTNIE